MHNRCPGNLTRTVCSAPLNSLLCGHAKHTCSASCMCVLIPVVASACPSDASDIAAVDAGPAEGVWLLHCAAERRTYKSNTHPADSIQLIAPATAARVQDSRQLVQQRMSMPDVPGSCGHEPVLHPPRDPDLPPPAKQIGLPAGKGGLREMLNPGTGVASRPSARQAASIAAVLTYSDGASDTFSSDQGVPVKTSSIISAPRAVPTISASRLPAKRTAAEVALVSPLTTAAPFQEGLNPAAQATEGAWKAALLATTASPPRAPSSSRSPARKPTLPQPVAGGTAAAAAAAGGRPSRPTRFRHVRATPPPVQPAAPAPPSCSSPQQYLGRSSSAPSPPSSHPEQGSTASSAASLPAGGLSASAPNSRSNSPKRVRFAPGHLNVVSHPAAAQDGHPATEGCMARPVRHVPMSFALDLTRGNVLMLEQMLGEDCRHSITRLKRRVGLLPPIRAPRPYACYRHVTQPSSAAAPVTSSSPGGSPNSSIKRSPTVRDTASLRDAAGRVLLAAAGAAGASSPPSAHKQTR